MTGNEAYMKHGEPVDGPGTFVYQPGRVAESYYGKTDVTRIKKTWKDATSKIRSSIVEANEKFGIPSGYLNLIGFNFLKSGKRD